MTTYAWDYLDEYEQERTEILDAVDTVFRSGRLVLGRSVRAFEEEFAAYQGVPHCVGVDNGTNAIVLALRALGVGPGDEVVTVANTAAATAVAIRAVGAAPVFVDVNGQDFLMDPSRAAEAITARTKALLPVHLYGQCADMTALRRIADAYGLSIVEDCAQAHGARQLGALAGSMGDAAAFSFYPTKILGAYGDAGAVITSDPLVDLRLRRLRNYGMDGDQHTVETPAYNCRLDEVHAEILRRKLRRLDRYVDRRRAVAQRYATRLRGTCLRLPGTAPGNEHAYHLYVVRHCERDAVLDALREHDIELSVHYRRPVHLMRGFSHLGYTEGSLPVTEAAAREVFSLPMYPTLTEKTQDGVVAGLHRALLRI